MTDGIGVAAEKLLADEGDYHVSHAKMLGAKSVHEAHSSNRKVERMLYCAKVLKRGKIAALRACEWVGASAAVGASEWRRNRLLILCYHGISIDDEHEWDPELYIPQSLFRQRIESLRESGCDVLPLEEGLERMSRGDLRRPSVAITFDDGTHDFYLRALPVIREYQVPVTVYLTTYYCLNNLPVFNGICSYLLWKARGQRLDARPFTGETKHYDLGLAQGRAEALGDLRRFADSRQLSGSDKNKLAEHLAAETKGDFAAILNRRMIHIMSATEVTETAAAGVDIQLHTHRHRTPSDRTQFIREIDQNRAVIRDLTGKQARHFCYPSGVCRSEFLPWLRESEVVSATTCQPGLASRNSDALLLPRLIDTSALTRPEFEGWISGTAAWLPRRTDQGEIKA
jgi:peptidoglycan/xylan/chitin deacetylase (PgdA/CDA1 family)